MSCRSRKAASSDSAPRVQWEWFCISNVIAVAAFAGAMYHLLTAWAQHGQQLSLALFAAQPLSAASAVVAVAATLYFFAFFGVAFMHGEVSESLMPPHGPSAHAVAAARKLGSDAMEVDTERKASPASAASMQTTPVAAAAAGASAVRPLSALRPEYDADVVIVGAGTAGASLAAVLARDGKRVVLIERSMAMRIPSIVGELMQPGGIRCLERMGLDAAAKCDATEGIPVEGYACVAPANAATQDAAKGAGGGNATVASAGSTAAGGSVAATACGDLILTYPAADPASLSEYFGVVPPSTAAVRRNTTVVPAVTAGAAGAHGHGSKGSVAAAAAAGATTGAGAAAGAAAAPPCPRAELAAHNSDPATGRDLAPRGRSFHNHLFVHQLRLAAMAEPNVSVHLGRGKKLLSAGDVRAGGAGMLALRTSYAAAPVFAGYDADVAPLGSKPAPAGSTRPLPADAAAAVPPAEIADDTISGVAWVDDGGVERVTTARLTVVCDGMYSVLRGKLHTLEPRTVSHFCGLLLHHAPHAPPVPYPLRGHVVMADPNPVLLYQISPTETRVLVDVPGALPSVEDGSLQAYFRDVIAPQLPAVSRPAFLEAVASQEPICMPNKHLPAAPAQRPGAVLLGDSWNMRHPLTGGGMTVALKDVEMLWRALKGRDMQALPPAGLARAVAAFQSQRSNHASTINVLANALYRVFSRPANDDGTRGRLRAACIEYLSMGGAFTAGPVGLLSGLTPKPGVLVTHFFAVALHAMRRALLPLPTPTRLRQGYDLLHVACLIIMPLLQAERTTVLSSGPVQAAVDAIFPWRHADFIKL